MATHSRGSTRLKVMAQIQGASTGDPREGSTEALREATGDPREATGDPREASTGDLREATEDLREATEDLQQGTVGLLGVMG